MKKITFYFLFLLPAISLASSTEAGKVSFGIWHSLATASMVVQLTLLTLILMSILSWAVIFYKFSFLKKVEQDDNKFLDSFHNASSLEEIEKNTNETGKSLIAIVFSDGYQELKKAAQTQSGAGEVSFISGEDNVERTLNRSLEQQILRLEEKMGILATIGSSGPFIGLFGTVWGIMNAFQKIGQTGVANLAVVAPGISEALVATAVGLFAAIPAVIFYNHFMNKVRKNEMELRSFKSDFFNVLKSNFFNEN